jgi:hypothetical protein
LLAGVGAGLPVVEAEAEAIMTVDATESATVAMRSARLAAFEKPDLSRAMARSCSVKTTSMNEQD